MTGEEAQQSSPRAPGWKQDPSGRFVGRYWDGSAWTEHVIDTARVRSLDPVPQPAEVAPPARSAPPPPQPTRVAPPRPATVAGPRPAPAPELPAPDRGRQRWWAVVAPVVVVVALLAFALSRSDGDGDPAGPAAPAPGAPAAQEAGSQGSEAGSATSTSPAPAGREQPAGGGSVASPAPPGPAGPALSIGATGRSGDFDVTVFAFNDPQPPGGFIAPAAGRHFVSADVQLTNRANRPSTFSSLLGFHVVDGSNRQFDPELTDITPEPPDGELAPGQAMRGLVVFDVPDGATGLRLVIQGNLTATGAVTFTLR